VSVRSDSPSAASLVRVAHGLSALLAVAGLTGLTLTAWARVSLPFAAGEAIASLLVIAAGVGLFRAARGNERPVAGLLPGELALDGGFLYLAMAAETFRGQHPVSRGVAIAQFAVVVLTLVAGSGALVFFRTGRTDVRSRFAMAVRSGVLLAVGSLLLAMAVATASASTFHLPNWNWASFLGLTVPGILVLIAREDVKKAWRSATHPVLAGLATDGLLVVGLSLMVWGSTANLTLGVDAFHLGVRGDLVGAGLWLLAAGALLARRMPWAVPWARSRRPEIGVAVGYLVALTAFVIGERAVELGKSPVIATGQAEVAGVLAIAAVVVLAVMRPLTFALDGETSPAQIALKCNTTDGNLP
jgi:hypothetical protein